MLESLEKLRNGLFVSLPDKVKPMPDQDSQKLADEIQGEVDEEYVRVPDEYWPLLECIENRAKPDVLEKLIEIAEKYGSLDAYIDKFYLPRPLFDDECPAQFGDETEVCGIPVTVDYMTYEDNGLVEVGNRKGGSHKLVLKSDRLKRPPEPDSQEKIDEECHRLAYVVSQAGNSRDRLEDGIRDLLARQRKLDGVDA